MNAAALLKSQGWRGKGHSLHATDNSIGLANPLLLSRNTDGRGLGQKPHYTSDQWWLAAFDEKLKGIDVSKGKVVQTATKGRLDTIAAGTKQGKYFGTNGLYASFVRGDGLDGTLTPQTETSEESTDATPGTDDREPVVKVTRKESREEKQKRREAKRLRKEARAERRAARAENRRAAEKAAKRAAKDESRREQRQVDSKEERRARRAERRARKEAKRKRREERSLRQVHG